MIDQSLYSFISSAALGIALSALPTCNKTPGRWLATAILLTSGLMLLTLHAIPMEELQNSQRIVFLTGSLSGTLFFLGLGCPVKIPAKIITTLIIILLSGFGLKKTLETTLPQETTMQLPFTIEETLSTNAEILLEKNLEATVTHLFQGKKTHKHTTFNNAGNGHPSARILERFADKLVETNQIGPLYVAQIKGIPLITTCVAARHTIDGISTETLLTNGTITFKITIIPAYYKDGKPQVDPAKSITTTIPFEAIFTMNDEINLHSIILQTEKKQKP
jgi:hypothetical protein